MPQLSPDSQVARTPGGGGVGGVAVRRKGQPRMIFLKSCLLTVPGSLQHCTEPDLKNTRFYSRFELSGLADSEHSSVIQWILLNSLQSAQSVGAIAW